MTKYISALLLSFICGTLFAKNTVTEDQQKIFTRVISLNGNTWRIAVDSTNKGRELQWFKSPPVSESRPTPVPWVIQDIFHNYHGVVWYWREFEAPLTRHEGDRYLLSFGAVDYLADIWVNGIYAGGHEGSETPFVLDVTGKINPGGGNTLTVRVLNPTYEPIDGIVLKDTPSGAKQYPFTGNAAYNSGGIVGSVDLLLKPAVNVSGVFVIPDWKTGNVKVEASIVNAGGAESESTVTCTVTDATTGLPVTSFQSQRKFTNGSNEIKLEFSIKEPRLWCPDDPALYRLELSVSTYSSADISSVRFGFRDFRFENGYFRLNGKRIFLKGTNFSTHFPVGYTVPLNEEMLRADVVNMKALGFNFVRIPFGCPNQRVLDIYDELGIMVQQEHFGCWQIGDYGGYNYPKLPGNDELLKKRFEKSISEVILRDRNHVSLVMWGVLNENSDGIIFRKAVSLLPSLRKIDPSRLFVLNSGRFDGVKEIGSMSSPGSETWDVTMEELKDWHPYVWMPYSPETLDLLSGKTNLTGQKSYISETGLCFPIDLPSELGDYQLLGKDQSDDALYYRRQYDKFLADWNNFRMDNCWARPEDYITDAYKTAAVLRSVAESAIRSNPFVVSYTPTNGVADAVAGESMATNFRRIKPDMIAPVLESNASVRWCLRTEPQSLYSGDSIRLTVSFSDLDVLPAGRYPATIRVTGPDMKTVYKEEIFVTVPEIIKGQEPPFAQEVFNKKIGMSGPEGKYLLTAAINKGATVNCGETFFYCTDRSSLPEIKGVVVLLGRDSLVAGWLKKNSIEIADFNRTSPKKRQLIIISGNAPDSLTMMDVVKSMACGSSVIFLTPSSFAEGKNSTRWLPLARKGSVEPMDAVAGYYRADRWIKHHALLLGMPSGGMMDYIYFRNIISQDALSGDFTRVAKSMYTYDEVNSPLDYPEETICGATRISHNYCSGIHLGIWSFGSGKFLVNTLKIAENLGKDPAADRLLCNIIEYCRRDLDKPADKLPPGFDNMMTEIGYSK